MKLKLYSFLFFSITISTFIELKAQVTDSLTYYSKAVDNPVNPDDLAKAFQFFNNEVLKYSKTEGNLTYEIYSLQQLAKIRKKTGYVSESELLHLKCLDLLNQIKNKTDWEQISYMSTINELGIIYRERQDYAQAINLYNKAISKAKKAEHLAVLYNNKGYVHEYKNELKLALSLYQNAYNKALKTNNKSEIARSLSNLSFLKSRLDINGAVDGLQAAFKIRKENNLLHEIGSSYDHLARYYYTIGDTTTSTMYSDDFLQLAHKSRMTDQIKSALKLKIETGEPQYAMEYINLTEDLNNLKERRRNNFNYYVYQYDKKEKDLQKSQLFNERLLYLILFIALASLSIYFVLKYKHRKEKLQEIYNTETRISRKIHDEVANDVYHVMTQLQTSAHDNKELLDNLENIYNRTRDISRQNSTINLTTPYVDLLQDLFLSYKDDQVNVITKGLPSINWEQLKDVQKTTIYRVLQELLTNMKKHSDASIVILSFEKSGKSLIINYKDNGKGTAIIKGNGLQNTENRIHSINGSITFESEIGKGFKAVIMI